MFFFFRRAYCGNRLRNNDDIIVDDIQGRHDCRAYRVFRYYIRKLTKDRCNRLPGEATRAERRAVRSSCMSKPIILLMCQPVSLHAYEMAISPLMNAKMRFFK